MIFQSRFGFYSLVIFGLVLISSFQNCAKEGEVPPVSRVISNNTSGNNNGGGNCANGNPFNCTSPTPTAVPSPTGTGGAPTPTGTAGTGTNTKAVIQTYGIKKGGIALAEDGLYSLAEPIEIFGSATSATGMKWGADNLNCTGSGAINCSKNYPAFGVHHFGAYNHIDVIAVNGSNASLNSDSKVVASQCFALQGQCKYFSVSSANEKTRPRALGVFIAGGRPADKCGNYVKSGVEGDSYIVQSYWSPNQNSSCLIFRVGIPEDRQDDYECFYEGVDSVSKGWQLGISDHKRVPCNKGKTLAEMGVNSDSTVSDGESFAVLIARNKTNNLSEKIVLKSTCTQATNSCEISTVVESHKRQTCSAVEAGGVCQ